MILLLIISCISPIKEAAKVSCLIFVERIITAKVVDIIVKRIADVSHLEVAYMTGNSTSVDAMSTKLQKETLESFHSGKVYIFSSCKLEFGLEVEIGKVLSQVKISIFWYG